MSDVEFARGFYWNPPHENAPDFVIGKVSINKEQFLGWLERQEPNEKGYVRLDIKRSRDGKAYASLDTWQPSQGGAGSRRADRQETAGGFDDSIPFIAHEQGRWV